MIKKIFILLLFSISLCWKGGFLHDKKLEIGNKYKFFELSSNYVFQKSATKLIKIQLYSMQASIYSGINHWFILAYCPDHVYFAERNYHNILIFRQISVQEIQKRLKDTKFQRRKLNRFKQLRKTSLNKFHTLLKQEGLKKYNFFLNNCRHFARQLFKSLK